MRSYIFAKRNFKEIVRDPLSLVFCLAFPIVLLLILEIIVGSIEVDVGATTPQFLIENLAPSIVVFSFSFLTLFSSMLIAKDRASSFQARLNTSPMKPSNFVLGYTLPLVPIALFQAIIGFAVCFIFGLKISFGILLALLLLIPSALLFISLGLLIGSLFNGGASSGISSIIINLGAIFGGMFFPIQAMTGGFVTFANILPFYPALNLVRMGLSGDFTNFWPAFLTIMAYVVVLFVIAIIVFNKKMKSEKK